jgi:hypothetical protein
MKRKQNIFPFPGIDVRKRVLGWNDNIEMDPKETGWQTGDWNHMAQDRGRWRAFAVVVMNLQVP